MTTGAVAAAATCQNGVVAIGAAMTGAVVTAVVTNGVAMIGVVCRRAANANWTQIGTTFDGARSIHGLCDSIGARLYVTKS